MIAVPIDIQNRSYVRLRFAMDLENVFAHIIGTIMTEKELYEKSRAEYRIELAKLDRTQKIVMPIMVVCLIVTIVCLMIVFVCFVEKTVVP